MGINNVKFQFVTFPMANLRVCLACNLTNNITGKRQPNKPG